MTRRLLAAAAIVAVAAACWYWLQRPRHHLTRLVINLPPGVAFSTDPARFALSPDGSQLAMLLRAADATRVWTWRLESFDVTPITGTEGVTSVPTWSPDGNHIAFVSGGRLRRIAAAGGPVETICELDPDGTADWGEDETILVAAGGNEPIRRVAASLGETVRQVTRLNPGERHEYPRFIPQQQRRFLFFVEADERHEGVWLGAFDGGTGVRLLPQAVTASVAGEYLVYSAGQSIVARRFNTASGVFSGEPATLVEKVRMAKPSGRLAYSAAVARPILAFQTDADGVLRVIADWLPLAER